MRNLDDYHRCMGCGLFRKTAWFLRKKPLPGGGYLLGCKRCGSRMLQRTNFTRPWEKVLLRLRLI